ncbi:MAG: glycosyltransferase family 4 protein, partial [Microlunatus sp.]
MRVLTVLDAYRLGGAETLIAQLGRVSGVAGLELDVISLHGPSPELSKLEPLLLEAGLEPRYLHLTRTVDPAGFRRLVSYLKQSRPDVVHAHLEMSMTLAIPAARLAGIPAVGTFHHVHRPLSGRASARERLAVEVASRSQAAIFV